MAGLISSLTGSLIAAGAYIGKDNERYSVLNHFISELGEVGVSQRAWAFNLGLLLAGVCLLPGSISLGLILPGTLAKIAMIFGVICAISLSFVGLFPMNKEKAHGRAAMTYFRTGLLMVILFSLAIAFQPADERVISPWFSLFGLLPIGAFSAFLVLIGRAVRESGADPLAADSESRPRVMVLAVVEWLIFISETAWFLLSIIRIKTQ